MMETYITSDTHFGHDKMREHRGQKFEHEIIENWNRIIKPFDKVVHLGDFMLGTYKECSHSESLIRWRSQLNGNIILVRGNHDNYSFSKYMKGGMQFCADEIRVKVEGKRVLMTHAPQKKDESFDINLHGHIHSNKRAEELKYFEYNPKIHRNVGTDFHGLSPIKLSSIIQRS